ncbi:MAG: right-handed parallel beta-helix repeat-containing protein [Lachnospiraceae bacterium]|nr:right-handed parallel beta-helix repeat-containing protein [Lachnospiraceae bacterium]
MKKKNLAVLLVSVLALTAFTGCDAGTQQTQRPLYPGNTEGPVDVTGGDEPDTVSGDSGVQGGTETPEDGTVRVSDVDGLIRAVQPGAKIVLEPGTYNLSEYLNEIWEHYGEEWNSINGNDHVWIEEVFDGVQLHFNDVDGMSIVGSSPDRADTEIITEPRYATLFSFHSSDDVFLSNLTMGHTYAGDCVGDVLDFLGCTNVRMVNMDIYGCGVYGISASNEETGRCGNFQIFDSTIRDCSYGALNIWNNNSGDWVFRNCELTGSSYGGSFYDMKNGKMCFYDCVFGDGETEAFSFRSDVVAENCQWGVVHNYPDVAAPLFFKDQIKVAPFDEMALEGTVWTGFETEDEDFGTVVMVDSSISFYDDGTALYSNGGQETELNWVCDGHYGAELSDADGNVWAGVTMYYDPSLDGTTYLNLTVPDGALWFLIY